MQVGSSEKWGGEGRAKSSAKGNSGRREGARRDQGCGPESVWTRNRQGVQPPIRDIDNGSGAINRLPALAAPAPPDNPRKAPSGCECLGTAGDKESRHLPAQAEGVVPRARGQLAKWKGDRND